MEVTEIRENDYKPDFEIADKYISFSSELLRLSLLAITGIGVLMMYTYETNSTLDLTVYEKYWFLATLLVFALAAGASLAHRFWASESLSFHISYLRKKDQEERKGRNRCLKRSAIFLIISEILFAIAILIFVVAIFQLFINH